MIKSLNLKKKMVKGVILPEDYHLNGSNYNMWYKKIYNLLRAKDLLNYIQNDYLKAVEENVKNGTMTNDDLRIANKNQGVAMTIIINNISDDVYNLIEDLDTPFEVMNAIKEEYDDEKSEDTERLIRKLYTLKARKLNQVASVLRKIKDVLTTLEKKNYTIGNMEKIRLVYYALPSELQDLKMFTGNESLDEAITKINNSVTLREFVNRGNTISCAENTKGKGKEKENEKLSKSDLMDIDFLSTPKREDNYCYICNMKGHTTKRCRYNSKEKYHKRNYKSNGKNGKNGKNRKYKNKNYYNKRNVGNIETNKNSDNFNNYYENYSDDENGQINTKLKHIDIKFYFNKDHIKNNNITLEYISTDKMLADVLTKCVNGPKMSRFSNIIFDKSEN